MEFGWIPEWPKGADCKSVGSAFEGSNPSPPISQILFVIVSVIKLINAGVAELADAQDLKSCGTYTPVSVRFRSPAYFKEFVGIAQLDRAFGYGPKGRGFESSCPRLITYHNIALSPNGKALDSDSSISRFESW